MTTHSQKKLDEAGPDRIPQPLQPAAHRRAGHDLEFYKPAEDSAEMRYLHRHRQQLGGYLPRRARPCAPRARAAIPATRQFALQAAARR
jgi:pyruvate dehydrogenase E1 component